jgi:hypothetical protein
MRHAWTMDTSSVKKRRWTTQGIFDMKKPNKYIDAIETICESKARESNVSDSKLLMHSLSIFCDLNLIDKLRVISGTHVKWNMLESRIFHFGKPKRRSLIPKKKLELPWYFRLKRFEQKAEKSWPNKNDNTNIFDA